MKIFQAVGSVSKALPEEQLLDSCLLVKPVETACAIFVSLQLYVHYFLMLSSIFDALIVPTCKLHSMLLCLVGRSVPSRTNLLAAWPSRISSLPKSTSFSSLLGLITGLRYRGGYLRLFGQVGLRPFMVLLQF